MSRRLRRDGRHAHAAPGSAAAAAFRSGGLGLSRAAWEQAHGAATEGTRYQGDRYRVTWAAGPDGSEVVALILRQYAAGQTVPLDTAQAEARTMLPVDATLVKTYTSEGDTEEAYDSPGLAGRIVGGKVAPNWYQDRPGSFTIGYQPADNGQIAAVYIGLSGTP